MRFSSVNNYMGVFIFMKMIFGANAYQLMTVLEFFFDDPEVKVENISEGVFKVSKKDIHLGTFTFNKDLIDYLKRDGVKVDNFRALITGLQFEEARKAIKVSMTDNLGDLILNMKSVGTGQKIVTVPNIAVAYKPLVARNKVNFRKLILAKTEEKDKSKKHKKMKETIEMSERDKEIEEELEKH